MGKKKNKADPKLQVWIDARKRHRLSHAHVQMARELGMNPKKFGKIDNHDQEPWKLPLRQFIEALYEKRFGRSRPENVISIEAWAKERARKKEAQRQARAQRRMNKMAENKDATAENARPQQGDTTAQRAHSSGVAAPTSP